MAHNSNLHAPDNSPLWGLHGMKKVAVLMVVLGEDASAEILRHMDENEVQAIGREVARLQTVASEVTDAVLEEFHQVLVAHEYVLKGGVDYARKLLINAFGPDHARALLDRLLKT